MKETITIPSNMVDRIIFMNEMLRKGYLTDPILNSLLTSDGDELVIPIKRSQRFLFIRKIWETGVLSDADIAIHIKSDLLKKHNCLEIILEGYRIAIDRSKPLDVQKFVGLAGHWYADEEDERSLAITELDLSTIKFKNALRPGEKFITDQERRARLRPNHILLDLKIMETLLKNGDAIRERIPAFQDLRREGKDGLFFLCFDGTILMVVGKGVHENHHQLCLSENTRGRLYWVPSHYDGKYANNPELSSANHFSVVVEM